MDLNANLIAIIGFSVLVIEFVLGKTKLVKANSTLEAILNIALKISKLFVKKQ